LVNYALLKHGIMDYQFKFEKLVELEDKRFNLKYRKLLLSFLLGLAGFIAVLFQLLFEIRDLSKVEKESLAIGIIVLLAVEVILYLVYDLKKTQFLGRLDSLYKQFIT